MLLHDVKKAKNIYGDEALIKTDVSKPLITQGKDLRNPDEYDYWDHVE